MKLRLRRPSLSRVNSRRLTPGRPTPHGRTARRSALALVTATATLGVAGCSVFSPATVLKPYAPSDGTDSTIGSVDVRNALVVSSGVDEPGVLSVVLANSGDGDAAVDVTVDVDAGAPPAASFSVPAHQSVHVGDPSAVTDPAVEAGADADVSRRAEPTGWLQIPQVPVLPGETVSVTFRVGSESTRVDAPVVLPCFEYSTITPTAPAAEPTASASPSASGSPSASSTSATTPTAITSTASVSCGPATGAEVGEPHEE